MASKMKLSIIIPVYNVECYVADTLKSCIFQNVSSEMYEVICVDDGSTDNSLSILKDIAGKHNNIRVFSKENGGVSQARNFGLKEARGEYIWFVDSDDLVAPGGLTAMIDIIDKESPDILWFKMRHFVDRPNYANIRTEFTSCANRADLYKFMLSLGGGGVCCNLYRRNLLSENNVTFKEGMKYSEDVLFHFTALLHAKKCSKTNSTVYFYRQRPGSAMHTSNPEAFAASMRRLVYEYDALLATEQDGYWKSVIIDNRDRAVRALLFSLTRAGEVDKVRKITDEMKKHGFYPYKLRPKALIRNKTYKEFLINLMSFMFPWRPYVLFTAKCFNFLGK